MRKRERRTRLRMRSGWRHGYSHCFGSTSTPLALRAFFFSIASFEFYYMLRLYMFCFLCLGSCCFVFLKSENVEMCLFIFFYFFPFLWFRRFILISHSVTRIFLFFPSSSLILQQFTVRTLNTWFLTCIKKFPSFFSSLCMCASKERNDHLLVFFHFLFTLIVWCMMVLSRASLR